MDDNKVVFISCSTEPDLRHLASCLIGDDFSFSYDVNTAKIELVTKDFNDLFGRLRSYDLDNFEVECDGKKYDIWGDLK